MSQSWKSTCLHATCYSKQTTIPSWSRYETLEFRFPHRSRHVRPSAAKHLDLSGHRKQASNRAHCGTRADLGQEIALKLLDLEALGLQLLLRASASSWSRAALAAFRCRISCTHWMCHCRSIISIMSKLASKVLLHIGGQESCMYPMHVASSLKVLDLQAWL